MMVFVFLTSLGGENFALETPGSIVLGVVIGYTVARFGLLTAVTLWTFQAAWISIPLPIGAGLPYAASSLLVIALLLAITLYAFRISLGSRPLLASALED
jgi:hypothetical protein